MALASEERVDMQNNESTPTEENPELNPGPTAEDAAMADLAAGDEPIAPPEPATAGSVNLGAALAEAEARVLRSQAELENFRKRSRRERDEERKYAVAPLIRDILPVIDNLRRAIDAANDGSEAAGLSQGVQMVVTQLSMVLGQHHCTEIPALHLPLDPNQHEAIAQRPSDDVPAGNVLEVATIGYKLHDRVLRPAQVVVSQGLAAEQA
jgi:molecular chaperone GrpE